MTPSFLPGLPMPLCEKQMSDFAEHFQSCEECQKRFKAFLNFPLIREYVPEIVINGIINLLERG